MKAAFHALTGTVVGAVAALAFVATASADTAQSVYEAAKKEGKVVFWTADPAKLTKPLVAAFNKKYPGVAVDVFQIMPGPATERAVVESRAKQLTADVVHTNLSYVSTLLDRDLVEPYPWDSVFQIDPKKLLLDKRVVEYFQLCMPIVINTSLVKPGEIKSWDDLLDPKWKGKIILEQRGMSFSIMALKLGPEKTFKLLRGIVQNKPIIVRGGKPTIEALASGQASIAIGTYASRAVLYKEDGAPVDWARVGPIPTMEWVAMPLKGAAHPNAARLFVSFLTTPEAQKVIYETYRQGVLTGPDPSPVGKAIQDAKLDIILESSDTEKLQKLLVDTGKIISGH